MKINLLIVFILFFFNAFSQSLKKVTRLPKIISESSGLIAYTDSTFLTLNDSGGEPVVYEFSMTGRLISETTFLAISNYDWEEITMDSLGFVYIGDIGNNLNVRNNLTIYKFHKQFIGQKDVQVETIDFYYPEQYSFPPDDTEMVYDAEAFLIWNDEIIVFTKCRTKPFYGQTRLYKIPNIPGRHEAIWINSVVMGTRSWLNHAVTGITRYKQGIAILTYSDWYELPQFDPYNKFWTPSNVIKHKLPFFKQREAITQGFDELIYITDERHVILGGGNLYKWIGKEIK